MEFFHPNDVSRVLRTSISLVGYNDSLVWHYSRDGVYSVKSAYRLASNLVSDVQVEQQEDWPRVWSLQVRLSSVYLDWWCASCTMSSMASPPASFVKDNVDATFFEDSSEMGVGIIIHDAEGEFVSCRTIVVPGVFRVDEGEVMGLLKALSWIKQLGFERVIFEIGAKVALVLQLTNFKAHYLARASRTFSSS
ncbi:hypothetical protein ACS0TY_018036 [Phlomoides rotata]